MSRRNGDDLSSSPQQPLKCVLHRALAMSALVCRASLEKGAGNSEAESLREQAIEWVNYVGVVDQLSLDELAVIELPLGLLSERQVIESSWRAEGLAILAWAVGLHEFPKHDVRVDPFAVTDSIGFLSKDLSDIVGSAAIRSEIEYLSCRELLYAIHSRLREYLRDKRRNHFVNWVEQSWLDCLGVPFDYLIADNDLALDRIPLSHVHAKRVQACEWCIQERHRAICWLQGLHPVYSLTPADT